MLTVKGAAALLKVSPGLVNALCANGMLRHERYGIARGIIRIPEEAIAEFRAASARGGMVRVTVVSSRSIALVRQFQERLIHTAFDASARLGVGDLLPFAG